MRKRLLEGMSFEGTPIRGIGVGGTPGPGSKPKEIRTRTPGIPFVEVEQLPDDVTKVKRLLFCRILLSSPTLLPIAMRSESVEEFLANEDASLADLRDVCLKLENPSLQDIRDACADLHRDNPDEENADTEEDDEDEEGLDADERREKRQEGLGLGWNTTLPNEWKSKREQEKAKKKKKEKKKQPDAMEQEAIEGFKRMMPDDMNNKSSYIDFGTVDEQGKFQAKKVRVKICGMFIYNYPSEKAMSRGRWLQFSIIAKDHSLEEAIELCRNWKEFYELNILVVHRYFPNPHWWVWTGQRLNEQLLQLGFILFFTFDKADTMTKHVHNTGVRVQKSGALASQQFRNFVCAQIDRDSPASHRLIQYMAMRTDRICVLVRDAKTGKILHKPPLKEDLWLEVNTQFFEEMEQHRKWHFRFDNYHDVYIWDRVPGGSYNWTYCTIMELLIKAHRVTDALDFFTTPGSDILKTITSEEDTQRVRAIKAGEYALSIHDALRDPRNTIMFWGPDGEKQDVPERHLLYNEADVLEDEVLFPDQLTVSGGKSRYKKIKNAMSGFEDGPNWYRFVNGLSTEDDSSEDDAHPIKRSEITGTRSSGRRSLPGTFDGTDEDSDGTDEASVVSKQGNLEELEYNTPKDVPFVNALMQHFLGQYGAEHDIRSKSQKKAAKEYPLTKEAKEYIKFLDKWDLRDYIPREQREMEVEFQEFVERERARAFKPTWHQADLEAESWERWEHLLDFIEKVDKIDCPRTSQEYRRFKILDWLNVSPKDHPKVIRDISRADATMKIFFPTSKPFFDSEKGKPFKDSLILKQQERAENLADRRSPQSSITRPKEHWKDWLEISKKNNLSEDFPLSWDIVIRPKIAHLFICGVIEPSYLPDDSGQAVALVDIVRYRNDHRGLLKGDRDLFFAFDEVGWKPSLQDPFRTTVRDLKNSVHDFAAKHPRARFAMLRLWSASHFYPLMIAHYNREGTTFTDCIGRRWEWKFVPKDMPYSEWSMNHAARERIKPFSYQFGKKVLQWGDLFIVMGEDEEELERFATAVTFAVQTKPWRWEVDLYRSFVNVDVGFLDGLKEEWWDWI